MQQQHNMSQHSSASGQRQYIPPMAVSNQNLGDAQYQAQSAQFINQMIAKRNKQIEQKQMPDVMQQHMNGTLGMQAEYQQQMELDIANLQVSNQNAQGNFTQGGQQQQRWSNNGQRRTQGAPGGRSASSSNS